MTQLGELRDALPAFEDAGVKLYAVSCDDRETLAAFASAHGIGFPLLSDPGSEVIRRYGNRPAEGPVGRGFREARGTGISPAAVADP